MGDGAFRRQLGLLSSARRRPRPPRRRWAAHLSGSTLGAKQRHLAAKKWVMRLYRFLLPGVGEALTIHTCPVAENHISPPPFQHLLRLVRLLLEIRFDFRYRYELQSSGLREEMGAEGAGESGRGGGIRGGDEFDEQDKGMCHDLWRRGVATGLRIFQICARCSFQGFLYPPKPFLLTPRLILYT